MGTTTLHILGHGHKCAWLILDANSLSVLARDCFYFAFNYIGVEC